VSFLAKGTVTVTVASSADNTIQDSIELTVKDTILDASYHADIFDYTGLKSDTPTFKTQDASGTNVNSWAHFKNVKGKTYIASATVNVVDRSSSDTWSRVGIGVTTADDSAFHGWLVSPGPSGQSAQKSVLMDISADGSVQWGKVTDRSQVWAQHGLSSLDYTALKLTTIRNGQDFYYFVNDELYWRETTDTTYADVDTIPTIDVGSMQASFSALSVSTETTDITAYLTAHEGNGLYFPTVAANVEISSDAKKIQFKNNNDAWPFNNIKDNAAKSLGDAANLPADKAATIEFDLTFDAISAENAASAMVTLTMYKWTPDGNDARSFAISPSAYGFTGWNINNNLPGIGASNAFDTALVAGTKYHVILNRLMTSTSQDCSMTVKNTDKDYTATWGWTTETNSTGIVTLSWGCAYANATIESITTAIAA
jgi:hypothetical protein